MDEWLPRRQLYLQSLILHNSGRHTSLCESCGNPEALWHCKDCLGQQQLCRDCCRRTHERLPFHRIQYWKGTHYVPDLLSNLGVVVNLGHSGRVCPQLTTSFNPIVAIRKSIENVEPAGVYQSPSGIVDHPSDAKEFTIGHTNGFHKVWIRFCHCTKAGREEYHLMELGLYPLSFQRVESAFTFHMLDDFRLENLECKTSLYHYHGKLQRMTSPLTPNDVPVSAFIFQN